MSGKKMRQWVNVRGLLLSATVLCVVLVATSSAVYAAPASKTAATSVSARPVTILDPFALRTVVVSDPQRSATAAASSVLFARPAARHVVHMPARLPLRSPFRPNP